MELLGVGTNAFEELRLKFGLVLIAESKLTFQKSIVAIVLSLSLSPSLIPQ
jgi:hypothetical protein